MVCFTKKKTPLKIGLEAPKRKPDRLPFPSFFQRKIVVSFQGGLKVLDAMKNPPSNVIQFVAFLSPIVGGHLINL